ncbi:hypothetical protein AB1Y20_009431 [Prymnesium parvum]|uniref:Glycosyl transferase CAP10 domain-containing protein n=1 Tax=Prymnesium parvum TaxID=97485 RepID=A0AB34K213_PRYPA
MAAPAATCEAELPPPLMGQLRRDMQHWPLGGITPRHLARLRALKPDNAVRAAVMIVNRSVFWQRPTRRPRSPMLLALVHDLQELADAHPLADVELVLNVDDYPFIPASPRPLPLFSHYQTREHHDILCPGGSFREVAFDAAMLRGCEHYDSASPWQGKARVGFWQGHPYCGRHRFGKCSRLLLSHLSAQNVSQLLDVGLTFYEPAHDFHLRVEKCLLECAANPSPSGARSKGAGRAQRQCAARGCANAYAAPGDLPRRATPLKVRPWVRIERHADFRYLLQLDGHSSSWRLQFLLATNSAVFKQSSYYWEYYYSALRPYVHYWPFWERSPTDVLQVLENASRPENDEALRLVGARGCRLAHQLLNPHARQCYWRALLRLYAARLQKAPVLGDWPDAKRVRCSREDYAVKGGCEGWIQHGPRTLDRVDWSTVTQRWRRTDAESLDRVVAAIELQIRAAPGFESDIESISPRLTESKK